MATSFGKILGMPKGGQSAHRTTHYARLMQDPSDNEEEDDNVSMQDGVVRQNGFTEHSKKSPSEKSQENIELKNLHHAESGGKPDLEVRVLKQRTTLARTRIACFVFSLLLCTLIALAVLFALPVAHRYGFWTPSHFRTDPWTKLFANVGTESCVRLYDVDGDGRLDIILGAAMSFGMNQINGRESVKKLCESKGLTFPCLGLLLAVRGYDGKELWRVSAYSEPFELNCDSLDINRDGKPDCIATGRLSSVFAVDPTTGTMLWSGDQRALVDAWNVYGALVVPDLDGDEVGDIVLAHGGDPRYRDWDTFRDGGRLMLLSGRTGLLIGRYMNLTGDKETYMTPVLHTLKDGSQYILFGSGGETVPGSLFAISVPDFYRYCMDLAHDTPVANTKGSYKWAKLGDNAISVTENGVIEIYRSATKGVMVPPLMVDMNKDGVKDLLVMAYDSKVMLLDGHTLAVHWAVDFPGFESYSTPAPGYFNDDDVLDFMVHYSQGAWPMYNYSLTLILDGKSGKTMWSLLTSQYEMTSDLVLRTKEKHRDAFVFRVQGLHGKPSQRLNGVVHGVDPQRILQRRAASSYYYQDPDYVNDATGNTGEQQYSPFGQETTQKEKKQRPQQYRTREYKPQSGPAGHQYTSQSGPAGQQYTSQSGPAGQQYTSHSQSGPAGQQYTSQSGPAGHQYTSQSGPEGHQYTSQSGPEGHQYTSQSGPVRGGHDYYHYTGEDTEAEPGHMAQPVPADTSMQTEDFEDIEEADEGLKDCATDFQALTTQLFVMDRSTMWSPIPLFEMPGLAYHYNLTEADRQILRDADKRYKEEEQSDVVGKQESIEYDVPAADRPQRQRRGRYVKRELSDPGSGLLCTRMGNSERTTGAVGDVDGDGKLDLIQIFDQEAQIHDELGSYIKMKINVQLVKINLEELLLQAAPVPVNVTINHSLVTNQTAVPLSHLQFLPYPQQVWTAYMGKTGTSIYHP